MIWKRLLGDESGQDMIEYAMLAGFVCIAVVGVFAYIAASIVAVLQSVEKALPARHG